MLLAFFHSYFISKVWSRASILGTLRKSDQSTISYTGYTTFLVWLTLWASVRILSTLGEQMVLQNSISTNDFSYSVQGWSFSPVRISKCLPKVLELLNDFLHSVVQLCGFSSLSMIVCSFSFPVCVNDLLHCAQMWGFPQYEIAYECSGF